MPALVSIIVPNYNHADFLSQRLQSIFQQRFTDFEVILLDDASADDSLKVLEEYHQHPKVSHHVINKSNSGSAFNQWQKGIALAVGKYIWIAESDDWADPQFLEQMVATLESDATVGLAYCQSLEVDAQGAIGKSRKWWTNDLSKTLWSKDFKMDGLEFIQKYLIYKNVIPNASAVVFRKQYLVEGSDHLLSFKKAGDWFVWLQLLVNSKVTFLAQPLNYFRTHDFSTRVYDRLSDRQKRFAEEYQIFQFAISNNLLDIPTIKKKEKDLYEKWRYLFYAQKELTTDFLSPTIFTKKQLQAYRFALLTHPLEFLIAFFKILKHRLSNLF